MDRGGSLGDSKSSILCGETSADNNVDRLSNLPGELITHIISFLPMVDAVRTDALSTKWKFRWTELSDFQICDCNIYSGKKSKKELFIIFLENVLMLLGNQEIESFSLKCQRKYDALRVHTWITALLRRLHVQKLRVCCRSTKGSLVFHFPAFDSTALQEIDLDLICIFKVPSSFCFPSLKILSLSQIRFQNMDFSQSGRVNISFPLLEELSLLGCRWEKVILVTIEAPVLKSFNHSDFECDYEPHPSMPFDCVLRIQGSMLSKFSCGPHSSVGIRLQEGLLVTEATIELASCLLKREYVMGYLTCSLLKNFSSLRSLALHCCTILDFSYFRNLRGHLPKLDSTLHLTITGGSPKISASLITLLLHLPCLESLTVICENQYSIDDHIALGFDEECPLPHLKVVSFLSINGNNELEFAKFIMKNAESLEKISLTADGSREGREGIIKRAKEELLNFPRASALTQINFVEVAD